MSARKRLIKKIYKSIVLSNFIEPFYTGPKLSAELHDIINLINILISNIDHRISTAISFIKSDMLDECEESEKMLISEKIEKLKKLLVLFENANKMHLFDRKLFLEYIAKTAKLTHSILTENTLPEESAEKVEECYYHLGFLTSKLQNDNPNEKKHHILSQEDIARLFADHAAYRTRALACLKAKMLIRNRDVHIIKEIEPFPVLDIDSSEEVFFCEATEIFYSVRGRRFFINSPHPHADNAYRVCLGELNHAIYDLVSRGEIDGALDMVHDLLYYYARDNAYFDPRGPECVICGETFNADDMTACDECGSLMCYEHVIECSNCSYYFCDDCCVTCECCQTKIECRECVHFCADCNRAICNQCCNVCHHCDCILCSNCLTECDCDKVFCRDCSGYCERCSNTICRECSDDCDNCGAAYCSGCTDMIVKNCDHCDKTICYLCQETCECGGVICAQCKDEGNCLFSYRKEASNG